MQVTPPRKPESRNVKINYKTAKRKEEIFVFLHEKKKKKKNLVNWDFIKIRKLPLDTIKR